MLEDTLGRRIGKQKIAPSWTLHFDDSCDLDVTHLEASQP